MPKSSSTHGMKRALALARRIGGPPVAARFKKVTVKPKKTRQTKTETQKDAEAKAAFMALKTDEDEAMTTVSTQRSDDEYAAAHALMALLAGNAPAAALVAAPAAAPETPSALVTWQPPRRKAAKQADEARRATDIAMECIDADDAERTINEYIAHYDKTH